MLFENQHREISLFRVLKDYIGSTRIAARALSTASKIPEPRKYNNQVR